MKFLKVANKHLKLLLEDIEWNPGDIEEVHALGEIDIAVKLERCDYDFYIVYDEDGIISVMSVEDNGYFTYYTTKHILDVNMLTYIKFFRGIINKYQDLFDVSLATDVWKDYKKAIHFLELVGFQLTNINGKRLTYGKQKTKSI